MSNEKPKPETKVEPQGTAQVTPPANPIQRTPADALAAGTQGSGETLSKSMLEALMNTTWEQTISEEQATEFRKGTEVESCVWIHGPARFQFLALADRRLTTCGNAMRIEPTTIEYVEKIHARLIPNTPYMVIRPASKGDQSATKVRRYESDSSAWANFLKLLGPTQFRVETGWKERYAVVGIPKSSPLGPGVVIDLSAPLERRVARKTKDEEAEEE